MSDCISCEHSRLYPTFSSSIFCPCIERKMNLQVGLFPVSKNKKFSFKEILIGIYMFRGYLIPALNKYLLCACSVPGTALAPEEIAANKRFLSCLHSYRGEKAKIIFISPQQNPPGGFLTRHWTHKTSIGAAPGLYSDPPSSPGLASTPRPHSDCSGLRA